MRLKQGEISERHWVRLQYISKKHTANGKTLNLNSMNEHLLDFDLNALPFKAGLVCTIRHFLYVD